MSDENQTDGPPDPTDAADPPTEPTQRLSAEGPGPRRLLRSREDRMIAGVAGGLARYFAVDPVIVRIGFAISVFFGGLGFLAYVALALFVPAAEADGTTASRAPVERSRVLAIGVGIALLAIALSWGVFDGGWGPGDGGPLSLGGPLFLLALGAVFYLILRNSGNRSAAGIAAAIALTVVALIAAGAAALFSAWAGATDHGVAIAAVIVATGLLLIAAAFRGGARWLLLPAVVLAVPLGFVAAADVSFGDGIGEREYTPTTLDSIPAAGYELGMGELLVDLRRLEWDADQPLELDVDLGIGEAVIAVPASVCVAADVEASLGELEIAGTRSEGVDIEHMTEAPPGAGPTLALTGEVDLGMLQVLNDDEVDLDARGRGFDRDSRAEDDEERELAQEAACAVEAPAEDAAADSSPDAAADVGATANGGDSPAAGKRRR